MLSTLKQLGILLILPEFQVRTVIILFCWCSASMVYYGVALNANNIDTDLHLYVFLGGLLEVPSYLLVWPALIYLGRRRSLTGLYLLSAVSIFLVLTLIMLKSEKGQWAVVVFSQAGKVTITAVYQLLWIYTAELYPTKYRSLAIGQSSMCAKLGAIWSPYINDLLGVEHVWGPSALFGAVSLLSAALTLLLPETRHSDLSELKGHQGKTQS